MTHVETSSWATVMAVRLRQFAMTTAFGRKEREMTSAARQPVTGRIEAFDSLRGIAAFGVVFWHYGAHFQAHPLNVIFSPFYHAGYLLVDFFFVLSGYVIARAYWKENRQKKLLSNIRSRIARLYPLHLFTLLWVASMQWALEKQGHAPFASSENSLYHFALNLVMLNGVGFQHSFSFNGPAWSISTEFVVNCAFMLFIASTVLARMVYIFAGIFVAVVLFSLSHSLLHNDRVLGYLDPQLVRCALGFGVGVILQLAHHREWLCKATVPTWIRDFLAVATLIGITLFLTTQRPHASVTSYFIVMTLSAILLATVSQSNLTKNLLQLRPLVFLGEISYSIYLVHFPLQLSFVLFGALAGQQIAYASPLVTALYFTLLVGISYLTYRSIELPCQALLNGKVRAKVTGVAASSL
jgi:peptidoglycan/LPS O-acetylase OafA/YrhL